MQAESTAPVKVPYGYCHCGCGQKTRLATTTRRGIQRGEPQRFVAHHGSDTRYTVRVPGPDYYTVEARGFDTPCWIWARRINGNGYGQSYSNGRLIQAHRWFYEHFVGPIPEGLDLDHLCRVRACVNPAHLEPVTNAINVQRGNTARLTEDDVMAILASPLQVKAIARQYGICRSSVWKIRTGKSWTHLYEKHLAAMRADRERRAA